MESGRWRRDRQGHDYPHAELTSSIIGAAIEVHRAVGPGLLESAYEACLCHELEDRKIEFERQVPLPVVYKGIRLDCGYRLDIVVAKLVVVELKTVAELNPVHDAQLLTYLKLSGIPVGLLMNFNVPIMRHGIRRRALTEHAAKDAGEPS